MYDDFSVWTDFITDDRGSSRQLYLMELVPVERQSTSSLKYVDFLLAVLWLDVLLRLIIETKASFEVCFFNS